MKIMNKLTNHNLKLNKKRTIVTIIGIMLSVALITAVATMFTSFSDSLVDYAILQEGYYNYAFKVKKDDFKTFDNNRSIESYYVTSYEGSFLVNSKNDAKPYGNVIGVNKEGLKTFTVNLKEGRLPENENEIVIPTHLYTNGRVEYKIGDTIKADLGIRKQTDTNEVIDYNFSFLENEILEPIRHKEYKVVGIMERPSYIIEEYSSAGYTMYTVLKDKVYDDYTLYAKFTKAGLNNQYKVISDITDMKDKVYVDTDGGNKIYEYANKNKLKFNDVEKRLTETILNAKYEFSPNFYLNTVEKDFFRDDSMRFLTVIAGIVITIIIVTSVYCIKNSFDISITEKTKLYGMLRSVGATKRQIRQNVLYEAFKLGLWGIPLGLFCGNLAAFILIKITNYLLLQDLDAFELTWSINLLGTIVAILLGALTILLSALRSARRAGKITPIVAIRGNDDIKIKSKKIKTNKLIDKIFGIGGVISDKNLKRNKRKNRTTIISITICVTTFIALSVFMGVAFSAVELVINQQDFTGSINVNYDVKGKEVKYDKAIEFVKHNDLIKHYNIVSTYFVDINNTKYSKEFKKLVPRDFLDNAIMIISLEDNCFNKYLKSVNLNINDYKDKAILIDHCIGEVKNKRVETDVFDYKIGDSISINYDDYSIFNEDSKIEIPRVKSSIEVGAIVTERPFGYSKGKDKPMIIVSESYIKANLSRIQDPREYADIIIYSDDTNKVQDEFEKQDFYDDDIFYFINDEEDYKAVRSLFLLIAIFLYGFIIVIALIGITNIYNTITTNISLRSREFAMLKSIGMTTDEFNKMIRLESLFLGVKSLFFGIPIGIYLGYLIYNTLMEGNYLFPFPFPYKGIIISIVVVMLLIFSLMKYSVSKINKQNIIETIRNENI